MVSSDIINTEIQDERNEANYLNEERTSFTISLVDITRKTNKYVGGMLINTYTNGLIICTTTLYVFHLYLSTDTMESRRFSLHLPVFQ